MIMNSSYRALMVIHIFDAGCPTFLRSQWPSSFGRDSLSWILEHDKDIFFIWDQHQHIDARRGWRERKEKKVRCSEEG